jgi:hypothetical protein
MGKIPFIPNGSDRTISDDAPEAKYVMVYML